MKWIETEAYRILAEHDKRVGGVPGRKSFFWVIAACSNGLRGDFDGSRKGLEMLGRGEIVRRGIGTVGRKFILDALDISLVDHKTEKQVVFLRRTVGNCQWLDNLTDEQWRVIERDILPILQQENDRRDQ